MNIIVLLLSKVKENIIINQKRKNFCSWTTINRSLEVIHSSSNILLITNKYNDYEIGVKECKRCNEQKYYFCR
jgi:hypothetical protein